MRTTSSHALGALLRKDFRISRWFIAGSILSLAANRLVHCNSITDRYPAVFIGCIPAAMAVLWGATNGSRQESDRSFERTHLPINIYHLWLMSAGFPVAVMLMAVRMFQTYDFAVGANYSAYSNPALELPALFMLSYFVSSVFTSRIAIVVGVSAIIVGPFIMQPFQIQTVFAWGVLVGATLAMLLSLALRGTVRADIRLGICAAVMVIAAVAPSAATVCRSLQNIYKEQFTPHIYTPTDTAITISDIKTSDPGASIARYRNARTDETYLHRFESDWHAAWADARGGVYFLESNPTGRRSKITRWETKTGSYRTLIELPLRPDFDTLCSPGHFASVDPTERYMVARLPSPMNSSADLWLFDLKLRKGQVVCQNAAFFNPSRTRWIANRALIPSYRSRVIEVNVSTGRLERRQR